MKACRLLPGFAGFIAFFSCSIVHQQHDTHIENPVMNATLIEYTEIAAWRDLIDAAPESFRSINGLQYREINGGLAINFQREPIPLFNRVIGSGLSQLFTQEVIDTIKNFYTHHEKYLVHYSMPMRPEGSESLLKQNGFYLAGSWERVVRNNQPVPSLPSFDSIEVKLVDKSLTDSWVGFLLTTYGFNFDEWPRAFAARKGWRHYVAFRNNKIIACRSFYQTDKGTLFSGVDAPVPGVMTKDCAPDFAIWKKAITDGLQLGIVLFVADIELPDKTKNQAAYDGFKQLGFEIPYTRYHYRLNK